MVVVVASSLVNKRIFRAQKWFASNSRKVAKEYLGKWVAVSGAGVESSANTLEHLEQKVGGRADLILTKIPGNLNVVCCY